MYWHMYVIVAICRESERLEVRRQGEEGGECRCNGEKSMYRGMKRVIERGSERGRESTKRGEGVSSGSRGWTRNASRDCVDDVYLRVIAHGDTGWDAEIRVSWLFVTTKMSVETLLSYHRLSLSILTSPLSDTLSPLSLTFSLSRGSASYLTRSAELNEMCNRADRYRSGRWVCQTRWI